MSNGVNEEAEVAEATPVVPDGNDAPEPEAVEPVRAWLVGYGRLGLINIVAESQEGLVARIGKLRRSAGLSFLAYGASTLEPFEVLSNNPRAPDKTTIWLDPLLIQAVLDEFTPRPAGAGEAGPPPGLAAMLAQIGHRAPEAEGDVAEVVVEPGMKSGE